jgi:hypothetical protein
VSAGIAIYVAFGDWAADPGPTATVAPAERAASTEGAQPLGGDPMSVDVPPLDQSDGVVAELVKKISSHPRVVAWLATRGLIRNFTAVVANIAEGAAPASIVPALRPTSHFSVIERGGAVYIDPESYHRYTELADAVASIDPATATRLYATLKPRIDEAYRDLGNREPVFDRALERAIILLVRTPVPDDPIALTPNGVGYAFADRRLEDLSPAQKQLLRMGPQNARAIQQSLREIALALGIPPARLHSSN